jgi:hypothetical protein
MEAELKAEGNRGQLRARSNALSRWKAFALAAGWGQCRTSRSSESAWYDAYSKHGRGATNAGLPSDICSNESRGGTLLCRKRSARRGGKRLSKAAPVLGIAGVSLAIAGGGASASAVGSVADMPSHNPAPRGVITLGEEEISDVSLSTFFVFDKENAGAGRFGEKFAYRGCRGCRGCAVVRGCGGCGCACCQSQGRCRYC